MGLIVSFPFLLFILAFYNSKLIFVSLHKLLFYKLITLFPMKIVYPNYVNDCVFVSDNIEDGFRYFSTLMADNHCHKGPESILTQDDSATAIESTSVDPGVVYIARVPTPYINMASRYAHPVCPLIFTLLDKHKLYVLSSCVHTLVCATY